MRRRTGRQASGRPWWLPGACYWWSSGAPWRWGPAGGREACGRSLARPIECAGALVGPLAGLVGGGLSSRGRQGPRGGSRTRTLIRGLIALLPYCIATMVRCHVVPRQYQPDAQRPGRYGRASCGGGGGGGGYQISASLQSSQTSVSTPSSPAKTGCASLPSLSIASSGSSNRSRVHAEQ